MILKSFLLITFTFTTLSFTGCSTTYTLRMRPNAIAIDTSSLSIKLKNKKYSRIMIMPPSGTKRGEFDTTIALFEKEFIKNGITPINGAITGRVVMQQQGDEQKKKDESAQNLSDVERALIMAKETGADALLQIGEFGWSADMPATRYFIAKSGEKNGEYKEVPMEEYQEWRELKWSYYSPRLIFIGRLTDVQTGEVTASFKVESASNWHLPSEYVATLQNGTYVISENYVYGSSAWDGTAWRMNLGDWVTQAKERAVESVIGKVAQNILGQ